MGECAGDSDEMLGAEALFGNGGIEGFPGVGTEFRFKIFEALEGVEAFAVGSGPEERPLEPCRFR